MVDRGNSNASVLIVGEAPGENEDLQGRAFVGRGGKLLDQLMKEVGFDTESESLIINVVKCRPPDNRRPKPEEAKACFPYLRQQIDFVKPKFVLLLGATALKHLIPEKKDFSMKSQVGKFFEHADFPQAQIMVLYHPAYILRDPRKKPDMLGHLQFFKSAYSR